MNPSQLPNFILLQNLAFLVLEAKKAKYTWSLGILLSTAPQHSAPVRTTMSPRNVPDGVPIRIQVIAPVM